MLLPAKNSNCSYINTNKRAMQDNRTHIDEKFINHAWGEMRKQLDQELPVNTEQKRRPFTFWWLTGLLLLVAGFGYYAYARHANVVVPKEEKPLGMKPVLFAEKGNTTTDLSGSKLNASTNEVASESHNNQNLRNG
ncbi:MAG: hypothetical protein IT258_14580 [Saprospiraceae bacterium]|nr:hypothetical protein [Saprospiraceae bacterium]